MSLFSKLRGTIETIFQLGLGGPQLKSNGGAIEAKNAADDAFVNISALAPTANDHVATKAYVDSTAEQEAVRQIRFTIGTGAAQNSTNQVPDAARVERCDVEITTAYNNSATISVGRTGSTSLLQTTSDNDPGTVNTYSVPQDTAWGGTNNTVLVTVGNTPSEGAGVVRVWYVTPLS